MKPGSKLVCAGWHDTSAGTYAKRERKCNRKDLNRQKIVVCAGARRHPGTTSKHHPWPSWHQICPYHNFAQDLLAQHLRPPARTEIQTQTRMHRHRKTRRHEHRHTYTYLSTRTYIRGVGILLHLSACLPCLSCCFLLPPCCTHIHTCTHSNLVSPISWWPPRPSRQVLLFPPPCSHPPRLLISLYSL